jgi:uncharacterized membrane protein YraQ (UPF0718 family)
MVVVERLGDGLWNAIQMASEVGWALVLGFLISGIVQARIPRERMKATLLTLMWAGVRFPVTHVLEAQARTHAEAARAGHQHTMAVAEDVPWRSRVTSCPPGPTSHTAAASATLSA